MIRLAIFSSLLLLPLQADEHHEVPDPGAIAVPAGQVLAYQSITYRGLMTVYASHSGSRPEVPAELAGLEASLFVAGPLTHADVSRLIENYLLLNGCVIRKTGVNHPTLVRGTGPWRRPAPGEQPSDPGPNPQVMAVPAGNSLRYDHLTVQEAANLLQRYTGKILLHSHHLSRTGLSINVPGPLTNEKAAAAIVKALEQQGLILKEFTPHEGAILPISPEAVNQPAPNHPPRVRRVP